jgi:hypothetical protein
MGQANMAAVEAAVIQVVVPGVEDTLEKSTSTWNKFKKGTAKKTNSRSARITAPTEDNVSFVSTGTEGFDFPTASRAKLEEMTVNFVRRAKTIEISGDVFDEADSSESVVDLITHQTTNATDRFDKEMNRDIFGDATSEIARVSTVSSTTLTCAGTTNLFGARHIFNNMELEFYSTGGSQRTTPALHTVSSVTVGSDQFVVASISGSVAPTDIVYPYGSRNNGVRGLLYHVANSGAYQGISDRTTYRGLNSVVTDASSAALSQSLLDRTLGNMKYKSGKSRGAGVSILWSPAQEAAYKSLGYDLKNFSGNKLDASFGDDLTHANVQSEWDVDCPLDKVFIGDLSAIERYELAKMGMEKNGTGGVFFQANATSGTQHRDAKLAYIKWKGNFGSKTPKDIALVKSLSVPSSLPTGRIN